MILSETEYRLLQMVYRQIIYRPRTRMMEILAVSSMTPNVITCMMRRGIGSESVGGVPDTGTQYRLIPWKRTGHNDFMHSFFFSVICFLRLFTRRFRLTKIIQFWKTPKIQYLHIIPWIIFLHITLHQLKLMWKIHEGKMSGISSSMKCTKAQFYVLHMIPEYIVSFQIIPWQRFRAYHVTR